MPFNTSPAPKYARMNEFNQVSNDNVKAILSPLIFTLFFSFSHSCAVIFSLISFCGLDGNRFLFIFSPTSLSIKISLIVYPSFGNISLILQPFLHPFSLASEELIFLESGESSSQITLLCIRGLKSSL